MSQLALPPIDIDLLSLPPVGHRVLELPDMLGKYGEDLVGGLLSRQLPKEEAEIGLAECGVRRAYHDPGMHGRKYGALVRALADRGLLEFRLHARETVGVFGVWKKSGKIRLIVDARRSNCHFAAAPPVALATGQAISSIEVDGHGPIQLGQVDIADAFYQLALPPELRDLFGLPSLKAGEAGISATVEGDVATDTKVFPCFIGVPMGWTQALHLCQALHEHVVDNLVKLPTESRLLDGAPPPRLAPLIHTEYVDNVVGYSQSAAPAAEAASAVHAAFEGLGLPTHGVETSAGGSSLGWQFSEEAPQVSVSPRRIWRLRLGIKELIRRGSCSGRELEAIIGHFTFCALLRRELLACLSASYLFIQRAGEHRQVIWDAVVRELRWCIALLPFCERNLAAPWLGRTVATDASPWGRGVVESRIPLL